MLAKHTLLLLYFPFTSLHHVLFIRPLARPSLAFFFFVSGWDITCLILFLITSRHVLLFWSFDKDCRGLFQSFFCLLVLRANLKQCNRWRDFIATLSFTAQGQSSGERIWNNFFFFFFVFVCYCRNLFDKDIQLITPHSISLGNFLCVCLL